jgi:hypothetical protein
VDGVTAVAGDDDAAGSEPDAEVGAELDAEAGVAGAIVVAGGVEADAEADVEACADAEDLGAASALGALAGALADAVALLSVFDLPASIFLSDGSFATGAVFSASPVLCVDKTSNKAILFSETEACRFSALT